MVKKGFHTNICASGGFGIPAYTMQGIHASLTKVFSRTIFSQITKSRIEEGRLSVASCTAEERKHIVERWTELQSKRSILARWRKRQSSAGNTKGEELVAKYPSVLTTLDLNTEADSQEVREMGSGEVSPREEDSTTQSVTLSPRSELSEAVPALPEMGPGITGDRRTSGPMSLLEQKRSQYHTEQPPAYQNLPVPPPLLGEKSPNYSDRKDASLFRSNATIRKSRNIRDSSDSGANVDENNLHNETGSTTLDNDEEELKQAIMASNAQYADDANHRTVYEAILQQTMLASNTQNSSDASHSATFDKELSQALAASEEQHQQDAELFAEEDAAIKRVLENSLINDRKEKGKAIQIDTEDHADDDELLRQAIAESLRTAGSDTLGQGSSSLQM